MALFESKDARVARERVAIQMGRNSVKEYVDNCKSVSQRYLGMAKKALKLDQRPQAEHYVATHLQYQNQAGKWESFILKIDDIVLRGKAINAMGGLMDGISHLCKNISKHLFAAVGRFYSQSQGQVVGSSASSDPIQTLLHSHRRVLRGLDQALHLFP